MLLKEDNSINSYYNLNVDTFKTREVTKTEFSKFVNFWNKVKGWDDEEKILLNKMNKALSESTAITSVSKCLYTLSEGKKIVSYEFNFDDYQASIFKAQDGVFVDYPFEDSFAVQNMYVLNFSGVISNNSSTSKDGIVKTEVVGTNILITYPSSIDSVNKEIAYCKKNHPDIYSQSQADNYKADASKFLVDVAQLGLDDFTL